MFWSPSRWFRLLKNGLCSDGRGLNPALRDFQEAPGVPRQIPFGSDSQVQIADEQPPRNEIVAI
jgi:hypothetical protein